MPAPLAAQALDVLLAPKTLIDRAIEARVMAQVPKFFGHLRVSLSETAHMSFINDGAVPGHRVPALLLLPVEVGIDHHALGHERRAVRVVLRVFGICEEVGEHGLGPLHLSLDGLPVRIEQKLVGIAAVPLRRIPRPIDAIAVKLSGPYIG